MCFNGMSVRFETPPVEGTHRMRPDGVIHVWLNGKWMPSQFVEYENGKWHDRRSATSWDAAAIIEAARNIVAGDRQQTHGNTTENHQNIAALWSAYLGQPLTSSQVALMMVLLKVARTKAGSLNRDDYVDMAGYAGVAAEIIAKLNGLKE